MTMPSRPRGPVVLRHGGRGRCNPVAENEPTQEEIDAAIGVLARTQRYSVKDNELDDWIA